MLNTNKSTEEMLEKLGLSSTDEIYGTIPENVRLREPFALPEALGEYDLKKVMQNLAGRNISAGDAVCFLGAGVYDHFVPSIVNKISEYASFCLNGGGNALESEGILQAVYELQIFMQRLTGMEAVNTTLNGMSGALEKAVMIALAESGKKKIAVSHSVNPEYRKCLGTYCDAFDVRLVEIGCADGVSSTDELVKAMDDDCALVMIQSPDYFGNIEDMEELALKAHENKTLFAAITDPLSLALLQTPGEYKADITIGNGQPLGGALLYGTHYFAYIGVNDNLKHYIEDGIVNMLSDGKFTLNSKGSCTSSRILSALSGAVYISAMGSEGLREAARACYSNAYYTFEKLTATSAFKPVFNKPFFREFAVKATKKNVNDINNRMLDYGMIGGVALKNNYPELGNAWLVAVTEKRSADEVELFVKEASRSI